MVQFGADDQPGERRFAVQFQIRNQIQPSVGRAVHRAVRRASTSVVVVLATVLVLGLTFEGARACATCMNDNPNRRRTIPILMGFIGVPFLVASGVFYALRRLEHDESRTWTSPVGRENDPPS